MCLKNKKDRYAEHFEIALERMLNQLLKHYMDQIEQVAAFIKRDAEMDPCSFEIGVTRMFAHFCLLCLLKPVRFMCCKVFSSMQ